MVFTVTERLQRMNTWIALLRGINVGGRNSLPMKELAAILEKTGAKNVRTYVQSGNVVFQSGDKDGSKLSTKISSEIKKKRGFEPFVLVLGVDALRKAIKKNPFPEGEADPGHLHLGFLANIPQNPNMAKLNELKIASEHFKLIGSVFYLHAPEGIGRSKLAAASEKLLGVPMTDRNWKTVTSIWTLVTEISKES